jgi:methionyl-tRNA synthetase
MEIPFLTGLSSYNMPFLLGPTLMIFIIWSLCWKGAALWRAGRKNQIGWFIALLLINTLGILEILYIFVFSKDKGSAAGK